MTDYDDEIQFFFSERSYSHYEGRMSVSFQSMMVLSEIPSIEKELKMFFAGLCTFLVYP